MSKFVTLHGFGGSGSITDLNFEIVGGTTTPSNPKENMIWINTDVKITNYDFNINEPENPVQGMVWIFTSTGTSTQIAFDAIKKNSIHIYPISARQYISDAWVDKTASIYQNEEWVDWISWIFHNGELTTKFGTLGNPYKYAYSSNGNNACSVSYNISDNVLTLSFTRASSKYAYESGYAYFSNKMDFTNISTIEISLGDVSSGSIRLVVLGSIGNDVSSSAVAGTDLSANSINTLDVSQLNNSYYLAITYYRSSTSSSQNINIKSWGYK